MKENKCYTMEWLKKASDEELLELQKKIVNKHVSNDWGKNKEESEFTYYQLTKTMKERRFIQGYYKINDEKSNSKVLIIKNKKPLIRKTILLKVETLDLYKRILEGKKGSGLVIDYAIYNFIKKIEDGKIQIHFTL